MENKKATDAKIVSKWAMILGCLLFFAQYVPYLILSLLKEKTLDLQTCLIFLFAGLTPAIIFTPVYFQLFMDKLVLIIKRKSTDDSD